jgi:hypothetical protein
LRLSGLPDLPIVTTIKLEQTPIKSIFFAKVEKKKESRLRVKVVEPAFSIYPCSAIAEQY